MSAFAPDLRWYFLSSCREIQRCASRSYTQSRLMLTPATPHVKARDKTRSGPDSEGRNVAPGENGQDVLFGPQTAPNSFKRSLDALLELMELIPSDWAVSC